VPLPWSGTRAPFGFSSPHAPGTPWLPQPQQWALYTVEAEEADAGSMLNLYRAALRIRRAEPGLGDGAFAWLELGADVLAFTRGDDFVSVTSFDTPVELPPHRELLLASTEVVDGVLPTNSTAWLRPLREPGETRTTPHHP
jgi:alpha-glucosidase